MKKGSILLGVIIILIVLAMACGGSTSTPGTPGVVENASTPTCTQVTTPSPAASEFSFSVYQGEEILGGSEVKFADLLDDGKPIVLNFWAGDCPPCRAEMPALQRVYEQHKEDIIFVGLDVGIFTGLGTRESGLRLLEELNVTYPAGAPPDRTPMVNYSVRSMPTTIFFGADGQIFRRWDGGISERDINDIVSAMVDAE